MFTSHHMSHVMCHVPCVTCFVPHVTCHMSFFLFFFLLLFLESGGASCWSLGGSVISGAYPHLVFSFVYSSSKSKFVCSPLLERSYLTAMTALQDQRHLVLTLLGLFNTPSLSNLSYNNNHLNAAWLKQSFNSITHYFNNLIFFTNIVLNTLILKQPGFLLYI